MSQFGDVLQQGLTSVGNFGSDALKGVGQIGGAIGNEAMALPGQIEGLFGAGSKDPTSVGANGNPLINAGAGAANGTTGAVGASAASAGTGATAASSASPLDLNYGSSAISAPQIPAGPASIGPTPVFSGAADIANLQTAPAGGSVPTSYNATGASGLRDASGYLSQAATGAANPLISTPQLGGGTDALTHALSTMAAPAAKAATVQPGAIQNLIHTLTQPDMLKMEIPGALFGLNAINAMKPTSEEKTMKAELANAQRNRTGQQNMLASEQAGYLPSALQSGIDLREQQAEAAVRQRYGQAGMSGSTSEAADIAAARTEAQLQAFQEAQSMIGQTAQLLGNYDSEVSQYLTGLSNAEMARDSALRNSIVGFLSAAGYGAPPSAGSKS